MKIDLSAEAYGSVGAALAGFALMAAFIFAPEAQAQGMTVFNNSCSVNGTGCHAMPPDGSKLNAANASAVIVQSNTTHGMGFSAGFMTANAGNIATYIGTLISGSQTVNVNYNATVAFAVDNIVLNSGGGGIITTINQVSAPARGNMLGSGTASVSYQHTASNCTSDSFQVRGQGLANTSNRTINVTVNAPSAPVAANASTTINYSTTPQTINLSALGALSGTPPATGTTIVLGAPSPGVGPIVGTGPATLTYASGATIYAPFVSMSYRVNGPCGTQSATRTLSVGVNPPPPPTVADVGPLTVSPTTATMIDLTPFISGVTNSNPAPASLNPYPLVASQPSVAGSGTTSISLMNGFNVVTFTPSGTFAGTTTFTYTKNGPGGTSNTGTVTLVLASPTVAVTGNGNSTAGSNVTFTATLSGGATPAGTVNFRAGAVTIPGCSAQPLASGIATCSTTSLAPGANSITAVYSGDGNNLGATSPPVVHTVTGNMTLAATPAFPAYGTGITLIASVAGTNPGGSVSFSVVSAGSNVDFCGAVAVSGGQARCQVPGRFSTTNPTLYIASYTGAGALPAAVTTLAVPINLQAIALSAQASPARPLAGQPVTLTAFVNARTLTGTVTFSENGAALAGCTAVALSALPGSTDTGVATCRINAITAGNHNYVVNLPHGFDTGFEQVIVAVAVVSGAGTPTQLSTDYSDMWWVSEAENGWGLSITQHGNAQFIVLYVYDTDGKPIFYVMPSGSWNAAATAYTGLLYQPTSSSFSAYDATQFKPGGTTSSSVGTATVTYASASTATLSYTINGVSGSRSIQRQIFATDDTLPRLNVKDMWWAGQEQNGWGVNIAQQGRILFPIWYTYGADGKATFFAVPGGTWSGNTFTGNIYATTSSPWLGVPYVVSRFTATKVGLMTLEFVDQSKAVMTYTVNGVTQTKQIERQPF